MSWKNESYRHSLASHGIKTRNSQDQKGSDDYYAQQPSCKRCGSIVGSVEPDLRAGKHGYYKCPKCGWTGREYIPFSACGIKIPIRERNEAERIGREFAHRFSSMDSLIQYGIDEAHNRIGRLYPWGTKEYEILMDYFYDAFEKEGKKLPPPPSSSSDIKIVLLKLIDDGNNDLRDIDAALYETDFEDELDELVKVGMVVETNTGYYRPYQIRRR